MVDIRPDLMVVLFTIGIALLAGLLFGLLPAIQAGRADLMAVLRTASGDGGKKIGRVRSGLVVVELAIAVMLLVGAGLLMRSFLAPPAYRVGVSHQWHGDRGRLLPADHLPACRGDPPAGR
jgi:hypothetical protein